MSHIRSSLYLSFALQKGRVQHDVVESPPSLESSIRCCSPEGKPIVLLRSLPAPLFEMNVPVNELRRTLQLTEALPFEGLAPGPRLPFVVGLTIPDVGGSGRDVEVACESDWSVVCLLEVPHEPAQELVVFPSEFLSVWLVKAC